MIGELYPGEFEAMEHNGRMDALEQEPCDVFDEYGNYKYPSDVELTEPNTATSMPCEDAINRQAAIDIVDSYSESQSNVEDVTQDIISDIVALPPVHSQPNTGHWKYYQNEKGDWINECSVCGSDAGVGYQYPYCPHCGAKMVEPQETETWNGYHGQITAPKGTFEKIYEDAESEDKE